MWIYPTLLERRQGALFSGLTASSFIASFDCEGQTYPSKNFVAFIESAELWSELLTKVLFSNPTTPWAMKVNSNEQTVVLKKTCFHYHKIVLEMTLPA